MFNNMLLTFWLYWKYLIICLWGDLISWLTGILTIMLLVWSTPYCIRTFYTIPTICKHFIWRILLINIILNIFIQKALSDSPNSVTFVGSSIVRTSSEVYEVLILLELCAGEVEPTTPPTFNVYCYVLGGRVVDLMNSRLKTGFSEELILRIFTDVCQAVARLHHRTKPILHRDLKVIYIVNHFYVCALCMCYYMPRCPILSNLPVKHRSDTGSGPRTSTAILSMGLPHNTSALALLWSLSWCTFSH